MFSLITCELSIEPKVQSLKNLLQSVLIYHLSITDWTQKKHSKRANRECLILIMVIANLTGTKIST